MHRLRLLLAAAGFLVALLGVALDNHQLAWGAIALLIGSLILRLLTSKRENRNPDQDGPV